MKPILKKTKRLFFKKWAYKITARIERAGHIKRYNLSWYRDHNLDPNIVKLKGELEDLSQKYEFQTRCEGERFSFFTNNIDFLNIIKNKFTNKIIEITEPENDAVLSLLKSNINVVVCEKLPKKTQRYKIYLNGKYSIPADLAVNFTTWAEKYQSKISIPYGLKYVLKSNRDFRPFGNYFYTSDDKMLSMALMFLGKHVQYTEKYVLKSELND
jgi:hypothetical protein